jgi:flagellar hook-length control protein FliK
VILGKTEIHLRKSQQGAIAYNMKIQIENMSKEISGESFLKKSFDSSYSDFGNTFQTQMNQIFEESNRKYAAGMHPGSYDNTKDASFLQPSLSNATEKTESVRIQNRSYKARDAVDRQRDKDIQSSDSNDDSNSPMNASTMTASHYNADKRSSSAASKQRDNADQKSNSSEDSKTSSDIQSDQINHESSSRSKEQKSDAPKHVDSKAPDSQSKTTPAQEFSDKSDSPATGLASEQQNQQNVIMPQSLAETNIQGTLDAKAIPDISTAIPTINEVEGGATPSLPATGDSSGKVTAVNPDGIQIQATSFKSALDESAAATAAGLQMSHDVESKAVELGPTTQEAVDAAGLQLNHDAESKAAEIEVTAQEAVNTAAATVVGLQMSHTAESKAAELGAAAQKTANTEAASRKRLQVVSDTANETIGKISITNSNPIQQSQIHAELNSASKSMNEASDSQTFTDLLKRNQAEATSSLKAGEASSDSGLGQNMGTDFLGTQASSSNELLLQVAQQNHQENVLPNTSVKTQKIEYKLDNALLSGSNYANGSMTGSTVGNLTQPVSTTQPKEFVLQVASRIQVLVRDGKGEIRVQLKPENMGQMEISAETTTSGVVAKITTGSQDVSNMLEANMHLLQQALKDQGLKIDRINIVVQNGFDASGSSGYNAQSGNAGSESNAQASQSFPKSATVKNESQTEETASIPTSRMMLNPNVRFHRIA